jgi:Tfp pilus assembly protein PilZ
MAVFPDDAGAPADLIVQADAALYGAKAAGKNRILLPQGERRRFRRLPSPQRVTLETEATLAAASIKNLSEGGLLVSLRETVAVGSAVSLTIERTDADPVALRGEVVRVERVPGESQPAFDVGVRFLDPPEGRSLVSPTSE